MVNPRGREGGGCRSGGPNAAETFVWRLNTCLEK